MKKPNCRKTPEEIEQHKMAVEIRKMTDAQICDYIDGIYKWFRVLWWEYRYYCF
jgi:hypothetical protein